MKLKKILTVLCIVALLTAFLSVTAFAVESKPFSATFNGYGGTESFSWKEKLNDPTRAAYIDVRGYNAATGNTSVGTTSTCGTVSASTTFFTTGVQWPQYPSVPRAGSYATLTVRAGTGVMGIGGYWSPQVQP